MGCAISLLTLVLIASGELEPEPRRGKAGKSKADLSASSKAPAAPPQIDVHAWQWKVLAALRAAASDEEAERALSGQLPLENYVPALPADGDLFVEVDRLIRRSWWRASRAAIVRGRQHRMDLTAPVRRCARARAQYGGSRYPLKFFRGTSREELLGFVQEVLQIGEVPAHRIRFLDSDGLIVLLNSFVPSDTVLRVQLDTTMDELVLQRVSSDASDGLQFLLHELHCVEEVLRSAALKRRRLQDLVGPAQAQRTVFRTDLPIYIRQKIFECLLVKETVRLPNVCRSFKAFCTTEGRRVIPVIDDRALRGGPVAAKRLARLVHPSFIYMVAVKDHGEAASAFLEAILSECPSEFNSLTRIMVKNARFVSATLLIRLLKRAAKLNEVKILTRLDRPLPAECLRSVESLSALVLHSTEVVGFSSLFTAGPLAALRFVQIVDSPHLNFDMLLGTFTSPCPTGVHVQHLQVSPSSDEPQDRHWSQWVQPLADLLQSPPMAALVQLDVPVPSYSVTAAETARALLERLQQRRLPRDLARLRFLPYKKNCDAFVSRPTFPQMETVFEIQEILGQYRQAWPWLEVRFPGVDGPSEDVD
ncbi:unnamed protein product [Symbiodinium necroappetens]|uniref:F-box domain-containing protein n=1 Tax=Symbiodinium necroappetens TaxID=1628268 RepID=A0A812U7Z8_9DINO|nr:unnamed protein product [Symbiodinium necroappetens]